MKKKIKLYKLEKILTIIKDPKKYFNVKKIKEDINL